METKFKELKSGTKLPLLNLRGKDYLQVAWRLVWFREEHPDWVIETEFVTLSEELALCKATVKDENDRVRGWAHKQEHKQHFQDHIEKSETGAIGRVLAILGYGTQFDPNLDEGVRIVDAPLELETEPRKTIKIEVNEVIQAQPLKQNQKKLVNHAPQTREEAKPITQDQLSNLKNWAIENKKEPEEISKMIKEHTGCEKSIYLNQKQYLILAEKLGFKP
jgi:hypothetical protein